MSRQGIDALVTPPSKKRSPRDVILYKKEEGVKFKKHIVICGKTMNRDKILSGLRHMKNIFEFEITMLGVNCSFTNMTNVHTCTVCSVDLFGVVILLPKSQLLQLSRDVIRSSDVGVPISIHRV
jgi:hypothetical protein